MSEAPLTDREFDAALREDATDEEIGTLLRDLVFWSYLMRDPFGKVCAVGRGTRADATRALAAEARPRPRFWAASSDMSKN
jgi:hypothetical protein